jgi:membrane protein required for beta-lactamase induction
MTFIVTLIALLIERFFDWSHLRHWRWYTAFQQTIFQRLPGKSAVVVLAATIAPLLIAVGVICFLLNGTLYGFALLVFELFIFLYCLGPQNLWADAFAAINALSQDDAAGAADKLKMLFGITDMKSAQGLHKQLLNQIFIQANKRVFAVVFWFVVLGPIGAVLYRTISLSASSVQHDGSPEIAQSALSVESLLDWIPIRIFAFIFALGGHCSAVLTCWRKQALQGLSSNDDILSGCGVAALADEEKRTIAEDGSIEREAVSLLDRTFVIVLVLVAVVALLL